MCCLLASCSWLYSFGLFELFSLAKQKKKVYTEKGFSFYSAALQLFFIIQKHDTQVKRTSNLDIKFISYSTALHVEILNKNVVPNSYC